MTVTAAACEQAIRLLRGAGVAGLADASPDVWAAVLNAAPLTTIGAGGRRTPVTRPDGTTAVLGPEDREVLPAATRIASVGGRFVQAADLAAAIQDRRHGDRQTRVARIRADAAAHGPLIPDGLGGDVAAELAWRRAATAAIGAGADRPRAEARAWAAIGRAPAALAPGADRSGDVRRLITAGAPEPSRDSPVTAGSRRAGGERLRRVPAGTSPTQPHEHTRETRP